MRPLSALMRAARRPAGPALAARVDRLERGVAAPMVALVLPVLLFAAALAIDVGMVLTTKASLQRAVDVAALSAAELMGEIPDNATAQAAARAMARQIVAGNGIATANLAEPVSVTFPPDKGNAVAVQVKLRSPSYFLRAVSPISQFTIAAKAMADVNSYAEVPIKPDNGLFGKIQQMNPAVFGPDGWRSRGDVYSTRCLNAPSGTCTPNTENAELPYGYLFRIDVPSDYMTVTGSGQLVVQLFDPDTYNDPTYNDAACAQDEDTCIKIDEFGPGWHHFYRVDEMRSPYTSSATDCNLSGAAPLCSTWSTDTEFTLWHFDPLITNAFSDPTTLSDQPGGAYVARATYRYDATTDLRWVTPAGFTVTLANFDQERDGGWSFYIYVKSTAGSSENNFDIRTGPPGQTIEPTVNQQQDPAYAWNSGNTNVYAKRAYPMNNAGNASPLTVYMTQVPANAAGQTLRIRHFDNDCSSSCSIPYYLEQGPGCVSPCLELLGTGLVAGNNTWGQTDVVTIPEKGTAAYNRVFPAGTDSAWLRAAYPATISQDTSVWEMIYIRPRLIQ